MPELGEGEKFSSPPPPPEPFHAVGAPIPMYDPSNQISSNGESFAVAINRERTRALREMSRVTGVSVRSLIGGDGLEWAISNTNKEVGKHFQAHGIAKAPVEDMISLLDKGLNADRTFYSMGFMDIGEYASAFGAPKPKTEGGIIVVANYDQNFPTEGDPHIKYIILEEEYMRAVDVIQKQYKNRGIKVIPWHDAPKVLTESYNEHNPNNKLDYVTINPAEPVCYPPKVKPGPYSRTPSFIPPPIPSPPSDSDNLDDIW